MTSIWDSLPSVCSMIGGEKFLIRQQISEAISRSHILNRKVVRTSQWSEVRPILEGSVWDPSSILIIFEGDDINEKELKTHMEDLSSPIKIVWLPSSKHKFLKEIPSDFIGKFDSPKPWDREDFCLRFLQTECKKLSIELPESLAKAMVKTLGTDLDLLFQEVWKISLLLKREERKAISVQDFMGVRSPLTLVTGLPLLKILGLKSKDSISQTIANLKSNSPTILPLLGLLTKTLRQWIIVKSLSGQDSESLSSKTGINSFVLKREILPIVSRWELDSLVNLMREIVEVKKKIKRGSIDPWIHLEAILLESLS